LELLRHAVSVQTYSTTSSRHFLLLTPCTPAVTGRAHCWVYTQVRSLLYVSLTAFWAAAVLALKNWGCNAPKFLWSRVPIPIRSPSIYETFKRENVITHHQFECNEISNSQSFRSTKQSRLILFTVTIITSSWQTGGAEAKNRWCNCAPFSNLEPPLDFWGYSRVPQ